MGIRFYCPDCGRRLNIKAFLAGKRGICPHCDARVEIPLESQLPANAPKYRPVGGAAEQPVPAVAAAVEAPSKTVSHEEPRPAAVATSVDPIAESPDAVWYVRPPAGGQYGPARGDVMSKWLAEGRVSADSMVWREGWADWQIAGPVFPELQPAGETHGQPEAAPTILVHDDDDEEERDISEPVVARRTRKRSVLPLVILGTLIVVLLTVTVLVLQRS